MNTAYCPRCGAQYLATVALCADCQVPLTGEPPEQPGPGGGLAGEQVVYDLLDWPVTLRIQADEALFAEGIPHVWEGEADLVVPAAFEDATEAILDRLEHPHQLEPEDSTVDDELAAERLSDLFVLADRLMNHPDHHAAGTELVELAAEVRTIRTPWGVPAPVWEEAQALAAVLRADVIARVDSAVIAKTARRLRDLLRGFV